MAVDVIALMGQVTSAQTAQLLGMDFSEWKLRKDDPGTPGSTVRGHRSRKRNNFVLVCASLVDLERAGRLLAHEGYASRLFVIVDETSRPGMVRLPFGSLPADCDVSLRSHKRGFVFSAESVACSLDIGRVVSSLVAPAKWLDASTRVAVQDVSLAKLVGARSKPGIGMASVSREPDSIPPFDLFLAHAGGPGGSSMADEEVALLDEVGVPVVDVDLANVQPVDLRWVSPVGFESTPRKDVVVLSLEQIKHRMMLTTTAAGSQTRVYDVGAGLSENVISDLRPYRMALLENAATAEPQSLAGLLAALACAGVPMRAGILPEKPLWGLSEALCARYAGLAGQDLSDDLERQIWSVETRRLAMHDHSLRRIWGRFAPEAARGAATTDSVSVLIPSRRPQLVASIVRQALQQTHVKREVIVGLHGYTAAQVLAADPWLEGEPEVSLVEIDTSLNLGQVLGQLSERASGDFIAKMDDDDLYTEHHLDDLLAASRYSEADLVGCKAEFVYLEGRDVTIQRRPNSEIYGGSVTGGTMLLSRATLRAAGGWSEVGTAEDRLLQESIGKLGGSVYRSHGLNYLMRRGDGARTHTWNPENSLFEKQAIREWHGLGYPGWRTSGHD